MASSSALAAGTPNPAPDPAAIGRAVTFISGQFVGKTIRAEISEIQSADSGRKCYLKDRRPLDPPPIALLTLWVVEGAGTPNEREHEWLDYSEIQTEGWLCHVGMFKYAEDPTPSATEPASVMDEAAGEPPTGPAPNALPPHATFTRGEDVTSELVGSTFVQAFKPDIDGRTAIVFPFTDVASKVEGMHCLRYQVFNLFAVAAGHHERPVLAECFGANFQVFNSRSFPGLRDVTALTKARRFESTRLH